MRTYKGIVTITCDAASCDKVAGNVEPECINCICGTVGIIDLEGKLQATLQRKQEEPEEVPAKKIKGGK